MGIKAFFRYFMDRNEKINIFISNILVMKAKIKRFFNFRVRLSDRDMLHIINVARKHEKAFAEFKGCYTGKKIAIFATGPSLNKYKEIPDLIKIGVNKSFLKENLKLDYLFMQDWGVREYIDKLDDPKYENIIKFFGVAPEYQFDRTDLSLKANIIPESAVLKYKARQYFQHSSYLVSEIHFYKDIETNYIECGGTVALAAMQFALYTNPAEIYIIGCDCSSGHYANQGGNSKFTHLIKPWLKLKEFADIYYPDTKIISVNPVGLKGVFEDLDQE